MIVSEFKLYETRVFTWSDDSCTQEPTPEQLEGPLEALKADGWEDDPVLANSVGYVNVRRLYDRPKPESVSADTKALVAMGLRIEALDEAAETNTVELTGMGAAIHRIGTDVEALRRWQKDHQSAHKLNLDLQKPPGSEHSPSLASVLDTEFAGAPWVLTVKGGTR